MNILLLNDEFSCSFVDYCLSFYHLFLLAIALSVLRITIFNYPFGIFRLFLCYGCLIFFITNTSVIMVIRLNGSRRHCTRRKPSTWCRSLLCPCRYIGHTSLWVTFKMRRLVNDRRWLYRQTLNLTIIQSYPRLSSNYFVLMLILNFLIAKLFKII